MTIVAPFQSLIAPLKGSVSHYCYLPSKKVMIQKSDYRFIVINENTFDELFFELDGVKTALKSDCIQYVIYDYDIDFETCPQWFIQAIEDGRIYGENNYNEYIKNDRRGCIILTPGCIILKNFSGQLMYMDRYEFEKYYEMIGE